MMAVGVAKLTPWSTLHYVSLTASIIYCWILPAILAEELPVFNEQPESQIISHKSPVTLACSATPNDAQIRWLFNGRPLDERRHKGLKIQGSNLHFEHLHHGKGDDSNDGEYRCTATTPVGTVVSRPAKLSKPVISRFSPIDDVSIVVPEGGYATLTCDPPRSSPSAYVVFQTESGELVDTSLDTVHRLPSGNVVLSNVTSASAGSFRCVAVNPVSGHNRTSPGVISLAVDKTRSGQAPSAHIMPGMLQRVEVEAGTDFTLECPSYGQRGANITWSKYGGSLPVGRFTLSVFGNLRITSTQYRDRGTYRCSSQSEGVGWGEGQVYLEILTPPVIQVTKEPYGQVVAGSSVEMACSVEGFPKPELRWYHNGRQLTNNIEGNLFLAEVTRADSGIYQCMATNELGTAYGVMRLEIGVAPVGSPVQPDPSPLEYDEELLEEEEDDNAADDDDDKKKSRRRDRKKHGRRKGIKMRDRRKKKKNGPGGQGEKEKPKYAPTTPTVTQLSDRSVMLNWSVPDRGNGQIIKFFKVQFKEMSPEKGPWRTSDENLQHHVRRFEVSDLKSGGSYKFRIFAVYEDNDNKNSPNTPIFDLKVEAHAKASAPDTAPTIVEVKPIVFQQKFGIGVKWQYKAESASPIEGFIIFYKPFGAGAGEDTEKRIPGAGIRNDVIRDLLPNTEYELRMQSFNMVGRSQFSNQVVIRTKTNDYQELDFPPEGIEPETSTDPPVSGRRSSDTLEQPVILGIVLGALLLALFILVTMCWWKQRQQKRRNLASNCQQKFQDQSQCIFTDNVHTKPNGGLYPANGNVPVANGHGPHHEGHNRMNLDINPLAEYDMQTAVQGSGRPKQYYGNGMNGMVPRFNNETGCSDNNFQHAGSNHHGCNGADLAYMEQQKGPYPMQHRTLPLTPNAPLHSFYSEAGSLGRSVDHEYSEPGDRDLQSPGIPSMYKQNIGHHGNHGNMGHLRNFDYNWSSSYDQPRMDKSHFSSAERLSPLYPSIDYAGNPNMYPQHNSKRLMPSLPTSSAPHAGVGVANFGTVPGGMGPSNPGSHPHPHGNGKHKRRRKRPHSRDQLPREHVMRDQATNTDLSSNEGTFEFTTFCRSGSSSNSGSEAGGGNCDSSFANNGSLESINDDDDSHSAASSSSHEPSFHPAANLPVSL